MNHPLSTAFGPPVKVTDPVRDMPRQIPYEILAALEGRNRSRIQHRVTGGIEHIHAFRPACVVPIQKIQRHGMSI